MGSGARSLFASPVDDRRRVRGDARRLVGSPERAAAPRLMMVIAIRAAISCRALFAATAQTTAPGEQQLGFGTEGLVIPPVQFVNGHTPRTAQLLGEAYRRHEPLVWKRVQYVAELGEV